MGDNSPIKDAHGRSPMKGKGRPTWPCGHRRIAYDGSVLPDPCQLEKVKAWDAAWKENAQKKTIKWENSKQLPASHRGKAVEELKPVKHAKQKLDTIENGFNIVDDNPELHPD